MTTYVLTAAETGTLARKDRLCGLPIQHLDPDGKSVLRVLLLANDQGDVRCELLAKMKDREEPARYMIDVQLRDLNGKLTIDQYIARQ